MEFEKRTDQNSITQNLRAGKEHWIWKKKKLLKQCLKEVTYEYILAFVGWWSIFWKMVGIVVYIFWLVVSGGECILAGGARWWMMVGGGGWWLTYFGWWWMVVGGGETW